jgi:hypothetical protein
MLITAAPTQAAVTTTSRVVSNTARNPAGDSVRITGPNAAHGSRRRKRPLPIAAGNRGAGQDNGPHCPPTSREQASTCHACCQVHNFNPERLIRPAKFPTLRPWRPLAFAREIAGELQLGTAPAGTQIPPPEHKSTMRFMPASDNACRSRGQSAHAYSARCTRPASPRSSGRAAGGDKTCGHGIQTRSCAAQALPHVRNPDSAGRILEEHPGGQAFLASMSAKALSSVFRAWS